MDRFQECHVASYSKKHVRNEKGKLTQKSIKQGIKDHKDVIDFQHPLSGSYFNYADAKQAGVKQLLVRYNEDRDVAAIDVK